MGCIHYRWLPVGSKFKNHLNLWLKMICRECLMQAPWERGTRWLGRGPVSMGSLLWYQKVLTLLKPIRGRSVRWSRVCLWSIHLLLIWLEKGSCEFEHKLPVKTARGVPTLKDLTVPLRSQLFGPWPLRGGSLAVATEPERYGATGATAAAYRRRGSMAGSV